MWVSFQKVTCPLESMLITPCLKHFATLKLYITIVKFLVLMQKYNPLTRQFYCILTSAILYVYDLCLLAIDTDMYVRFICSLCRMHRISHKLCYSWLNMQRWRLFTLHYVLSRTHSRQVFRRILRNINIRRKDTTSIPRQKTTFYKRSFSYNQFRLT